MGDTSDTARTFECWACGALTDVPAREEAPDTCPECGSDDFEDEKGATE